MATPTAHFGTRGRVVRLATSRNHVDMMYARRERGRNGPLLVSSLFLDCGRSGRLFVNGILQKQKQKKERRTRLESSRTFQVHRHHVTQPSTTLQYDSYRRATVVSLVERPISALRDDNCIRLELHCSQTTVVHLLLLFVFPHF
jgi:hypothetical protein